MPVFLILIDDAFRDICRHLYNTHYNERSVNLHDYSNNSGDILVYGYTARTQTLCHDHPLPHCQWLRLALDWLCLDLSCGVYHTALVTSTTQRLILAPLTTLLSSYSSLITSSKLILDRLFQRAVLTADQGLICQVVVTVQIALLS